MDETSTGREMQLPDDEIVYWMHYIETPAEWENIPVIRRKAAGIMADHRKRNRILLADAATIVLLLLTRVMIRLSTPTLDTLGLDICIGILIAIFALIALLW